jgi:hypothetical protein
MSDVATELRDLMAENAKRPPEPGIHRGTPMGDYHAWEAASNSRLTKLMRSPAHLRAYLEQPPEETSSLITGRAAHSAILEPDDFTACYVRGPEGDRRTKKVKDAWDELCDKYGDGYVLRPSDYDACLGMKDAVHGAARAKGMLTGPGDVEMSCVWTDPASGVLCKGRMDRHSPDIAGGAIVDLKTTRDASPLAFERSIFAYGYHRQAAMYLGGAKALGIAARHYVIIAVEKTPPYGVGIYRLTEGAVQGGADQLRPLLALYAEIQTVPREKWWGYADEVRDISLPAYAWSQLDEQVEDVA